MIEISKDKALALHRIISLQTGGSSDLRDEGLLESALESAFQTFDGVDLYPAIEEKGARIGFSLISNHAFADGNKRIGILIMLTFLEVNGVHIEATNDEVAQAGYSVANGAMDYVRLLSWVRAHTSV